jgi:hypothetical protein
MLASMRVGLVDIGGGLLHAGEGADGGQHLQDGLHAAELLDHPAQVSPLAWRNGQFLRFTGSENTQLARDDRRQEALSPTREIPKQAQISADSASFGRIGDV